MPHLRSSPALRGVAALALTLICAPLVAQPVRLANGARTIRAHGPELLDLNSASRDAIAAINGIGQLYADKIVAGRPYKARSELVQRDIIPVSLYLRIKHQLIAMPPEVPATESGEVNDVSTAGRLDINTASRDELTELKGIGLLYADKIIAGRPFKATIELVGRRVLPPAAFDQIKDRIVATRGAAPTN
ncbi:MAG: helix-hairpin-helix domain-containing protein [Gemmatimonadota bacterium]